MYVCMYVYVCMCMYVCADFPDVVAQRHIFGGARLGG